MTRRLRLTPRKVGGPTARAVTAALLGGLDRRQPRLGCRVRVPRGCARGCDMPTPLPKAGRWLAWGAAAQVSGPGSPAS